MGNMLGKRAQQKFGGVGSRHCRCCHIDAIVDSAKRGTRSAEKVAWRKDVQDLPQGESDLQEWFDAYTVSDGGWRWGDERLGVWSYWAAVKCLDEIHDRPEELPPGFDGVWSTDSAHVMLMRKQNRMGRVYVSLGDLARAADGSKYAAALVNHPRFEKVIY